MLTAVTIVCVCVLVVSISCAVMVEVIAVLIGVWTYGSPRSSVLDGGLGLPMGRGTFGGLNSASISVATSPRQENLFQMLLTFFIYQLLDSVNWSVQSSGRKSWLNIICIWTVCLIFIVQAYNSETKQFEDPPASMRDTGICKVCCSVQYQ